MQFDRSSLKLEGHAKVINMQRRDNVQRINEKTVNEPAMAQHATKERSENVCKDRRVKFQCMSR